MPVPPRRLAASAVLGHHRPPPSARYGWCFWLSPPMPCSWIWYETDVALSVVARGDGNVAGAQLSLRDRVEEPGLELVGVENYPQRVDLLALIASCVEVVADPCPDRQQAGVGVARAERIGVKHPA